MAAPSCRERNCDCLGTVVEEADPIKRLFKARRCRSQQLPVLFASCPELAPYFQNTSAPLSAVLSLASSDSLRREARAPLLPALVDIINPCSAAAFPRTFDVLLPAIAALRSWNVDLSAEEQERLYSPLLNLLTAILEAIKAPRPDGPAEGKEGKRTERGSIGSTATFDGMPADELQRLGAAAWRLTKKLWDAYGFSDRFEQDTEERKGGPDQFIRGVLSLAADWVADSHTEAGFACLTALMGQRITRRPVGFHQFFEGLLARDTALHRGFISGLLRGLQWPVHVLLPRGTETQQPCYIADFRAIAMSRYLLEDEDEDDTDGMYFEEDDEDFLVYDVDDEQDERGLEFPYGRQGHVVWNGRSACAALLKEIKRTVPGTVPIALSILHPKLSEGDKGQKTGCSCSCPPPSATAPATPSVAACEVVTKSTPASPGLPLAAAASLGPPVPVVVPSTESATTDLPDKPPSVPSSESALGALPSHPSARLPSLAWREWEATLTAVGILCEKSGEESDSWEPSAFLEPVLGTLWSEEPMLRVAASVALVKMSRLLRHEIHASRGVTTPTGFPRSARRGGLTLEEVKGSFLHRAVDRLVELLTDPEYEVVAHAAKAIEAFSDALADEMEPFRADALTAVVAALKRWHGHPWPRRFLYKATASLVTNAKQPGALRTLEVWDTFFEFIGKDMELTATTPKMQHWVTVSAHRTLSAILPVLCPRDACSASEGKRNRGEAQGDGGDEKGSAEVPSDVTGAVVRAKLPVLLSRAISAIDVTLPRCHGHGWQVRLSEEKVYLNSLRGLCDANRSCAAELLSTPCNIDDSVTTCGKVLRSRVEQWVEREGESAQEELFALLGSFAELSLDLMSPFINRLLAGSAEVPERAAAAWTLSRLCRHASPGLLPAEVHRACLAHFVTEAMSDRESQALAGLFVCDPQRTVAALEERRQLPILECALMVNGQSFAALAIALLESDNWRSYVDAVEQRSASDEWKVFDLAILNRNHYFHDSKLWEWLGYRCSRDLSAERGSRTRALFIEHKHLGQAYRKGQLRLLEEQRNLKAELQDANTAGLSEPLRAIIVSYISWPPAVEPFGISGLEDD